MFEVALLAVGLLAVVYAVHWWQGPEIPRR